MREWLHERVFVECRFLMFIVIVRRPSQASQNAQDDSAAAPRTRPRHRACIGRAGAAAYWLLLPYLFHTLLQTERVSGTHWVVGDAPLAHGSQDEPAAARRARKGIGARLRAVDRDAVL